MYYKKKLTQRLRAKPGTDPRGRKMLGQGLYFIP